MKKSAIFGKTFSHYALKENGVFNCIFPSKKCCQMCTSDESKIIKIKITVTDQSDETYYGWYDYKGKNVGMIFKRVNQFNCCFTYGVEELIKKKKGEIVHLKIEEDEQ